MNKHRQFKIKTTKNGVIIAFMLFICVFSCNMSYAAASFSLNTLKVFQTKKITLNIQNKSAKFILTEIEKKSGLDFIIKDELGIEALNNLSINVKDVTIESAMDTLLSKTDFTYKIADNIITIVKKNQPQQSKQIRVTVKGSVIEKSSKKPIPGATILVVNSTVGAISDDKGHFILTTNTGQEIEVTYVGMKSERRKITEANSELIVALEKDEFAVNDVIVTGYQEINKERMTGSYEAITSKDIVNRGYTSVSDILKGQMSGVAAMNLSGRPGAQAQVRIRGINSLSGNSDPMWIVDGMPLQGDVPKISMGGTELQETLLTSGIGNISPDDIESITVLKDAAATAIYGSRAANGVIVIKTKRGSVGKSYISAQVSYAISDAPKNRLKMMNTGQKLDFERTIYEDFPGSNLGGRMYQLLKNTERGSITKEEAQRELNRLKGIDTNWFDEIFRVAHTQNYGVTLSGGSETTQYYSSLSYQSEEGILPNNVYKNFGANLKLTHDFTKWLRVNFDIRSTVRSESVSGTNANPLKYATYANPYERVYDENGNYEYDRSFSKERSATGEGYKYNFNIIKDMNENTNSSKYLSNQVVLKLEAKIIDGLMFSTMGSYSNTNNNTANKNLPGSYSSKVNSWVSGVYKGEVPDNANNGQIEESSSRSEEWTIRNQIEFAKGFSDGTHYVSAYLGQEASSSVGTGFRSMIPEWSELYRLGTYPEIDGAVVGNDISLAGLGSHSESQNRSASFFFTGSYSFKDRYVVSGSARLDGADIIGTKNRFSPLWNVSGKWNLHNEKFMSKLTWINQLAFRASFGYTASIDHNALPFSTLIKGKNSYTYDGIEVLSRYNPSNPSIKWQRKQDRNIGFDASILRNRVNLTINYYNNNTTDLLDTEKVAISTGRFNVKANVASINNSGWEFSLRTLNVSTNDFTWTTSFNLSINKSVVTETRYKSINEISTSTAGVISSTSYAYIQGERLNAYYGYKFAGIDPLTGGALAYVDGVDAEGNRYGSLNAEGRYVFNMDQQKLPADMLAAARCFIGESHPPVTGGFNTQFSYKRFSLSANFTFMTGHLIPSFESYGSGQVNSSASNVLVEEVNRWRKPGDITTKPKYSIASTEYLRQIFDFRFEKGAYLKCNNISLGYNVTPKLCEKLRLNSVRLNFNMGNLFTLTKYRGIDVETMGSFTYPSARKYNFSLSIGI